MLVLVDTPTKKFEDYKKLIPERHFGQVKSLAKELKGLKVFHVNSTPKGGGVAEVLKSLIPLMKAVGIEARWYSMPFDEDFFRVTKKIHNGLQGENVSFSNKEKELYKKNAKRVAAFIKKKKADVWIMHDPQPAGAIDYLSGDSPFVSRVHIDTTNPNKEAWDFFVHFLEQYDKVIFTSKNFIKPGFPKEKTLTFTPAIDPLSLKNKPISLKRAKSIMKSFGINPRFPLIAQVSRFDRWKDPLGVIEAFSLAKKEIPNLQLALVGFFLAQDDPEAKKVFQEVEKAARNINDIYLFSDKRVLSSLRVDSFVRAIQASSDVVLQKSIKEGFGLTVAEAMWKGKSVIGGNAKGIKLQIEDGKNGFLVSSTKEASKRIVELIKNPKLADKLGKEAKSTVREKFLTPRLLRDYLKLIKELSI